MTCLASPFPEAITPPGTPAPTPSHAFVEIPIGNSVEEVEVPASHKASSYALGTAATLLVGGLVTGAIMWGVCDGDDGSVCRRVEDTGIALVATCSSLIAVGGLGLLGLQYYKVSKRRR